MYLKHRRIRPWSHWTTRRSPVGTRMVQPERGGGTGAHPIPPLLLSSLVHPFPGWVGAEK